MKKNYRKTFLNCMILFVIFSLSIGYSAFSSELSISKIVADVRVKQDIRITDISVSSSSSINGNYGVPKTEYDADSIILTQVFASYDDFIDVDVNVTNFGNIDMGIFDISFPEGVGYNLDFYELKEKICDDTGKCNLGASKKIKLKLYPTSDEGFNLENSNVDFDFREMHSITYGGVTNNGYSTEIIDGGNLNLKFTSDIPENVVIYSEGVKVNSSKYTYSNGTLTMNNVSGNLTIKSARNLFNIIKLKTNGLDTNIDFASASSSTNGDGVNTVSGTEGNSNPIYYYRGAVTNNNVKFADFCWKIVRTTETGGVKLIYNGVPTADGSCNASADAVSIGNGYFNNAYTLAHVGYMYGTIYTLTTIKTTDQVDTYIFGNDVVWDGSKYTLTDTMSSSSVRTDYNTLATKYHYTCFNDTGICENVYYMYSIGLGGGQYLTLKDGKNIEKAKEEMFTNTTDSTIKTKIDNWYAANMTLYTDYLEDTVWCNDRTLTRGGLVSKDANSVGYSYFAAEDRFSNPSITCSNTRDSFSVSSANGNGKLTYPVGLLTSDEYTMAGSGKKGYSTSAYLYTGKFLWSLSPSSVVDIRSIMVGLNGNGYLAQTVSADIRSVRPSVSLKPGTYVLSDGDGTVSNPYIVD